MVVDAVLAGAHRVDRQVRGAEAAPPRDLAGEAIGVLRVPADPTLHADALGGPARAFRGGSDRVQGAIECVAGSDLREPSVGEPTHAPVGRLRRAADPDRDGLLDRHRGQPRAVHDVEGSVERQRWRGPQPSEQLDLLVEAAPSLVEALSQRLVLDGVPADAHAEPEAALGEQIHLRRLLGGQRRLALREDDDPGDELQRRDGREVAEHHEGLVEGGRHVVGTRQPACTAGSAPRTWS